MSFSDFHFLRPWWLLALLPAALLLAALIRHRQGRGNWSEVCDAELLPFILQDKPLQQSRTHLFGAGLAALLTIVALAGPTWQRLPSPAFRNDAALVIALDLSKSMDAADIKPSRIAKARYKIADLLKQRKDGQTALLVYGGDAFTVTPLTNDTATIDSQLVALTTDIMPSPGSNTGVALDKAAALLRQAGLAKGHILLVSDGVDADVAEQAEHWLGDYRLSVLALGTPEGAPIPVPGGGFVKDNHGAIVVAKLDESALATLAEHGRGIYQPVAADDEDVENLGRLFNAADTGTENQDGNLLLQQWDEKGPWLLLLVLPWAAWQFRKGLLLWGLLFLWPIPQDSYALDWQSLWQTPNQRAQQAFNQQQYQQAADQFDNPDWRAAAQYKAGQYQQAAETLKDTQNAEGHYNRGNALAQAGQLQEALQAYQQALKLDPGHRDAQYNKDIVERKLKEQEQQQPPNNQQQDNQPQDQQQKDKTQSSEQQQKQQDQQPGQSDADQQHEQKPEDSQPPQAQQDAEQSKAAEDKQSSEAEAKQPAQPSKPEKDESEPTKAAESAEKNETERANEQLLKRIPDEPTGLLKRKFKYQYNQRRQQSPSGPTW
ncbi:VWA domain-containing protein [Methylomonas montana]|uniref:vWA domain-containing protein n=1 Tax=Methylomonas montana TaxID=3058963 RepID=UPI002659551E|nr:VWA domain-containing protein [Methylomonas montana]WKJ90743.1 VWA domain-containing protein [Methylomonas montana]